MHDENENPLVDLIKRLTEDLKLQLEARERLQDQLCQEIEQGTYYRLKSAGQAVQIEDLQAEVARLEKQLACNPRGLGAN
jgi:hypothetical protein